MEEKYGNCSLIITFQANKVFAGDQFQNRRKRHCVYASSELRPETFSDRHPHPNNEKFNDNIKRKYYWCYNSWGAIHPEIWLPATGAVIQVSLVVLTDLVKLKGSGRSLDMEFKKKKIDIIKNGVYMGREWH